MHLILDMDNTLIDNMGNLRPYLEEFFIYIFYNFQTVSIWTNAKLEYYNKMYETIFKNIIPEDKQFYFVYTRSKTVNQQIKDREHFYHPIAFKTIKPLKKVFRAFKLLNKYNTLIIDDKPCTFCRNYGNGIRVSEFNNNNKYDTELKDLILYFEKTDILKTENVRTIEKRYWNETIEKKISE